MLSALWFGVQCGWLERDWGYVYLLGPVFTLNGVIMINKQERVLREEARHEASSAWKECYACHWLCCVLYQTQRNKMCWRWHWHWHIPRIIRLSARECEEGERELNYKISRQSDCDFYCCNYLDGTRENSSVFFQRVIAWRDESCLLKHTHKHQVKSWCRIRLVWWFHFANVYKKKSNKKKIAQKRSTTCHYHHHHSSARCPFSSRSSL